MQKLSRRHVIATMSGSIVSLCPAILNAQTLPAIPEWADIPTTEPAGTDQIIMVETGAASVDITDLSAGEIAVIGRPTTDEAYTATNMVQYVAVHRRTADQIAAAEGTERSGEYFVVNLLCSHRGKAIGLTGDPAVPFACTDRGGRHSSNYDVTGFGIAGASEDEFLSIPDHTIDTGDQIVLQLA